MYVAFAGSSSAHLGWYSSDAALFANGSRAPEPRHPCPLMCAVNWNCRVDRRHVAAPVQALERGSWLDAWIEAPSPDGAEGKILVPFFTETDLRHLLRIILEVNYFYLCFSLSALIMVTSLSKKALLQESFLGIVEHG
jgi:hypothetical protein